MLPISTAAILDGTTTQIVYLIRLSDVNRGVTPFVSTQRSGRLAENETDAQLGAHFAEARCLGGASI